MGLDDLNSSDHITILAFASDKRESSGESAVDTFDAVFSVESYTRRFENSYQGILTTGINSSSRPARYSHSLPGRLNFHLIIDATGADKSPMALLDEEAGSATEQVEKFLAVCYRYDGEIHEPRYLVLKWGEMSFNCRLESVEVKYSLFDKGGKPKRAELDTAFIEDISDEERTKTEDKQSPDVGRIHTFVAGDSLPLIAKKHYGSSRFFLALAVYNTLDHFREIQPGTPLKCPPLAELPPVNHIWQPFESFKPVL